MTSTPSIDDVYLMKARPLSMTTFASLCTPYHHSRRNVDHPTIGGKLIARKTTEKDVIGWATMRHESVFPLPLAAIW